ncbi:hypothetical protein DRE_00271 [Drechslerella stenobrocha 248]|uniref:C3H1-type domain-containing protein n=1 Tax=Drechslerella stenobrocha 248 TaxID=1043628 RepID=W7HXS5_9PEZI|nr:hypothetical protein DRE_00271 [Drechslerella stenobrocha 248]
MRSMLMAHGCCFDYFEKGFCKAGNDCKYSHLKPGDERNLVMDSEYGLRRKKYYRPETLQTYLPGSQDVICFTFARKGWCIHGDKCWNQHIAPPQEVFTEPSVSGLSISNTPSPVQGDMPTIAAGYNHHHHHHPQVLQTPARSNFGAQNPWSASTLAPQVAAANPASEQHPVAVARSMRPQYCHPDPMRTASANWRIPNNPAAIAQATKVTKTQAVKASPAVEAPAIQEPVCSALNFNWRPVINESAEYQWQKAATTAPSEPTLQTTVVASTSRTTLGNLNSGIDYEYDLIDFSDDVEQDFRKYRMGVPLNIGPGEPDFYVYH